MSRLVNCKPSREESGRLTKGVVDANSPGHSLLTLDGGENLSGVLESDWTFAQRITDGEKIHEQDDWSDLRSSTAVVVQEGKTCGQQEDTHKGESLRDVS